jgi:acyl-CoA oxidase
VPSLRALLTSCSQEDIFRPNHYLSLMEFRELTLQRLKRFTNTDFNGRRFDVRDYLNGEQQKW